MLYTYYGDLKQKKKEEKKVYKQRFILIYVNMTT